MIRSWCNRILEGLLAGGVEDLVVTPGSRSTPLLLAAIASPLRLHSVIDERSAAYFALGRARGDNKKVALLCTSGSAGAHYLPALLEARYAGHCVVAITADRPPELHESGSNQTIAQTQLLAAACPAALELGAPTEHALAARRRVQQALALATGPIHINLAFRKPLEQSDPQSAFAAAPAPATIWPAEAQISNQALDRIAARCKQAKRGVIVAGPCQSQLGPHLLALAKATGFVLLAESTSGARFCDPGEAARCDAYAHILGVPRLAESLRPDLVLQLGDEPSGAALLHWMASMGHLTLRLPGERPRNTPSGGCELFLGPIGDGIDRLLPRLSTLAAPDYAAQWRREDQRAWACANKLMQGQGPELSESEVSAAVLRSLAPHTQLTIGNSLSIRNADAVLQGKDAHLRVLHQRGTSGIEGLIAGAIGSSSQGPNALVLGDVSAAHDLSSLALSGLARGPLRILMIDNGGGQIFSQLPVAKEGLSPEAFRLWLTPPSLDFQSACAAHTIPYRRVHERAALSAALRWSQEEEACSFTHIQVQASSMQSYLAAVQEALQ